MTGWVSAGCRCGQTHWGTRGAAGLLLTDPARTAVLLQRRSRATQHGGTWGLPGGAIDYGETPAAAAVREGEEEAGLDPREIRVTGSWVGSRHGPWIYTYVLAEADRDIELRPGPETTGLAWVELERVAEVARLHPDLAADWPDLSRAAARR